MEYMREQLRRVGNPVPKVVGIDAISIRKGPTDRIVVSNLVRRRPIWLGGEDRSVASLDAFYAWLGPKKFARMIDRPWDGIAAYCKPENKVALGFVEGFNNKIRVIPRRSYGLRDEEYLRLKVLTCILPPI